VAKRTIAEFERGGAVPYRKTVEQLREALEVGGIIFIPENGGGAGVRRRQAIPRFGRKKINRFDRVATIIMSYRGQDWVAELPTEILDDIDRTNYETDGEYEKSLDAHRNKILMRAAAAIDSGRGGDTRRVVLTAADFPECG
jgi:hypothetical protein